jgi:cytidine deaminase
MTSIEAVAVVADADDPTPPCGGCRQVLNEFGPRMLVVCEGASGRRSRWVLSEVLPHAFGPSNLST